MTIIMKLTIHFFNDQNQVYTKAKRRENDRRCVLHNKSGFRYFHVPSPLSFGGNGSNGAAEWRCMQLRAAGWRFRCVS